MRKVVVASAVLAGVLVGNLGAADYKSGYKYKNNSESYAPHRYESTDIKCSNGNGGAIFNYYNRDSYQYVVDVTNTFQSFEEAANFICDKSTKKITLKNGAMVFKSRTGNINSIVNCLTSKLCKLRMLPVDGITKEGVRFVERDDVILVKHYTSNEAVIGSDGNVIWDVSANENSKIKKYGYKKVMLVQGYYEVKDGSNNTYYVPESEVEK
ncbi:MAG: hypothetical protein PHE67_11065 [Campylobacterales bacterium]|nr:hypothetical protein [Campylobacterales bacterium]